MSKENSNTKKGENQEQVKNRQLIVTDENWQQAAAERLISIPGQEIDEEPCISIISDGEAFRFGTLGNFSMIIEKPKSRKTTLVTILIAEALKNTNE